jgi:FlaA1/EpsC-like NDP-sugar epimerase
MLDMGEPVKILDLARDMIRLSGLEEGADIEIHFTGLRPGEKLYEEMFFSHEVAEVTEHSKILRARNGHRPHGDRGLLVSLISAAQAGASSQELRNGLLALVPDFTAPPLDDSVGRGSVRSSGETSRVDAGNGAANTALPYPAA